MGIWVEPSNNSSRRRLQGHTTVRSGKRVIVYLQDGSRLLRRFKERSSKYMSFFDGPDIPIKTVATITIYKPKQD